MAGAQQFQFALQQFGVTTRKRLDIVTRKICLEILRRVVLKTPVLTGRLRGNWQAEVNKPAGTVLDTTDKTGAETIANGAARMKDFSGFGSIFITNHLPYVLVIEYGGRTNRTPRRMLTDALLEVGGGAVAAQAIQDALKEQP